MLSLVKGDLWGDPQSGWWFLFYTEWAARVAAYVLWDAYDNCRLWALSPILIGFIRQLDLAQVLGSRSNADELIELITEIENTVWEEVSPEWSHRPRGSRVNDLSPGCVGEGGDFV